MLRVSVFGGVVEYMSVSFSFWWYHTESQRGLVV